MIVFSMVIGHMWLVSNNLKRNDILQVLKKKQQKKQVGKGQNNLIIICVAEIY